jgi:hypothetical protein
MTMTRQATATTATTATTSNHHIPMNCSHGYGTTATRVGVVKLQWPSEVWITGRVSTEQVQLHPNYVRSACPAKSSPVMPMMAEMVRLALRSILMEVRVACPIFWDRRSQSLPASWLKFHRFLSLDSEGPSL